MRKMFKRSFLFLSLTLSGYLTGYGQVTFPENGIADPRSGYFAFTHATIMKDGNSKIENATMIIKDGRIQSIAANAKVPNGAVEIDCSGKFIYPSFIDIYSDYGLPESQSQGGGGGFNFGQPPQIESTTKGPYGWNQSIKSDVDVYKVFAVSEKDAKPLRDAGFGTVLTHVPDGVARGTGAVVTLADQRENLVFVKERASAHYSFNRGTSRQSYPTSMMGYIALLRQTYLDANWYKNKPYKEGFNLSLQAWNDNQNLPQIFEANDKWNALRADRIGDEFGVQYIIKAGQNEYQRIKEMKSTGATFILPLNFPQAQDVEDPNDAAYVSVTDMKHWELAPTSPAAFEKAGINFCLTTADLRDARSFMSNLKKAMLYGLSEKVALEALTKNPATALGIYDKVGSLEAGKLANFLITNGPVFDDKTLLLSNYVQGIKYDIKDETPIGVYELVVNSPDGDEKYTMEIKSSNNIKMYARDTLNARISTDGKVVKISYAPVATMRGRRPGTDSMRTNRIDTSDKSPVLVQDRPSPNPSPERDSTRQRRGGMQATAMGGGGNALPSTATRLSGFTNGTDWNGTGTDSSGNPLTWTARLVKTLPPAKEESRKKEAPEIGDLVFPFEPFGWKEADKPKQENILIRNATVWTNEKEGILQNADVLIKNGKISAVGKGLSASGARVIDGTGKHVTPGIIDEHSHIAAASINEGGQSVSSEVRIADNLNPDDVNIYRQLSGGVTTSHILHGSANVIGGQTQLIKLRWGANDDDLKFEGSAPFIKFALGENVKRSSSSTGNIRYPDTRMGVEELLVDAFTRAKDYQKEWDAYNGAKNKKDLNAPRKDLELEALSEILNKKRFITCHSYVQSEINMAMKVAEQMGYTVNTFTHILEGYKVADKMLAHGSYASTFSDWWAYKMEVEDAIPYNASIMQKVGLTVAINSDDAEMARRLNQEAAKIVKYGGVTEEEALKMVTLNPAKMLHVADKVGSLKPGKDGDVVLWTDHPLSIYAKPVYTIIDGTVFFDRAKDEQLQASVDAERLRLIKKMNGEKRSGSPMSPAQPSYQIMHTCSDHGHSHGFLTIDADDINNY